MQKRLVVCAACAALLSVSVANTASFATAKHHKAAKASSKTVTTASGLKYQDIVVGKGASPKPGQMVTVDYVGTLMNGTKFDASGDHPPGTFDFAIGQGQVIKGWDEGVMSMKIGGTRKLTIPPGLAYGERGAGGVIPPNATLIFTVKLLAVH